MLRAYAGYMKQTRFGFGQEFISDTLCKHPQITRDAGQSVRRTFRSGRYAATAEICASGSSTLLDQVELLNEDRILRRMLEMIEATQRTNYFQRDADGAPKPQLALKIAPRLLRNIPPPAPLYEILVFSPRVEGVHLRAGPIARGGLRWSDRAEDYRTEVLGLVKAQTVKNAVIVPTGAKGGFFVRRPPAARDALMAEAVACYRQFISGLLDVTDNIVDGVGGGSGTRVRRYDGDDPYLVVAADKGTATFSDFANEVAAAYGFWLGDAFASGGSNGYDHKKMAITARGAWISRAAAFQREGHRRPEGSDHGARYRRHVGRRVRQRTAAIALRPARGGVQPSARVRRSKSGSAGEFRRTRAIVRATAIGLERLRTRADFAGRRRVCARRRSRLRSRRRCASGSASRSTACSPDELIHLLLQGADRPDLERRHRYVRKGSRRNAHRCWRSRQRRRQGGRGANCARRCSAKAAISA